VDLKAEIPLNDPIQPNTTEFCAVFASLLAVIAGRRDDGRGRPSLHKQI